MDRLPRHIPPRRPSELWERLQSLGVFGFVLVGALVLFVLGALVQGAIAFLAGMAG